MSHKKLVIMTRKTNEYFIKTITASAKKLNIDLYLFGPDDFELPLKKFLELKNEFPDPKETVIWNRISGTTYDDYDLLVLQSWQNLGAELLNSLEVHETYRNKYKQYIMLDSAGIPLLDTYYLPNINLKMLDSQGPFVAKTLRGAKGKGVIKLENKEDLKDFLTLTQSMGDKRFLIQNFVKYEEEHRVLVLKGKILGHYIKKNNQGHWKHSLAHAQWHRAESTSKEMIEIVNKVHELDQKFFFAVDFINKNNELFVLEVNLCPGVEGPDAIEENSLLEKVLAAITL